MTGPRRAKPGSVKPSISDHNASVVRDAEAAEEAARNDPRFPAGMLLVPGTLCRFVASMAGMGKGGVGMAWLILLAATAGGLACFGVVVAKSNDETGKVVGYVGIGLAILAFVVGGSKLF